MTISIACTTNSIACKIVASAVVCNPAPSACLQTLAFSPSALLARENAIVVCFESIRCIITLNCVYVVNPEDEKTHGLIDQLNTQV